MGQHAWLPTVTGHVSSPAPASLVAMLARLSYAQGEQRLMLAILLDALGSIERYARQIRSVSRSECRAAMHWVTKEDRRWIFSFENICLALDLDPAKLRAILNSEFPVLFATTVPANTLRPPIFESHGLGHGGKMSSPFGRER
ncbi:MAG: hypothetical protein HYZ50_08165 [Deltaproteobacteria bacterium]|nr:hypothetical protein [Deltaproteobacteria bacterium]